MTKVNTKNTRKRKGVLADCSERYSRDVYDHLLELSAGTVVLLLAEHGMGRRAMLNDYAQEMEKRGRCVLMATASTVGAENTLYKLAEMLDDCKYRCSEACNSGLIVFDDLPIGDEDYYASLADIVQDGIRYGISFVLGSLPEGEVAREWLSDAICLWSRDMLLKMDAANMPNKRWRDTYGIPSLVSALRMVDGSLADDPLRSSGFNEEYRRIVRWTQRDTLMKEDRSICAVMLLMGFGTLTELRGIISVDEDTWHGLARDEPILGIDEGRGTFSCVMSDSALSTHAIVRSLVGVAGQWTKCVPSICRLLVGRSLCDHAAIVSTAAPESDVRSRIALEHCFPFMNCGQIDIVRDAVGQGLDGGCERFVGYNESVGVLSSLFYTGDKFEGHGAHNAFGGTTERSMFASLSCAVREVLRGEATDGVFNVPESCGKSLRQLATHGKIVERLVAGDVEEAYLLAFGPDMYCADDSVIAALLAADRVALSTLVGSPLHAGEVTRLDQLMEFLGYALKTTSKEDKQPVLNVLLMSYVTCARVLSGVGADENKLEAACSLAAVHGDVALYGALMLASAITDLRSEIIVRAKSRLKVARRLFEECGAVMWSRSVALLLQVLSIHLCEDVDADSFGKLTGASDEFDGIVYLVVRALLTPRSGYANRRLNPEAPKSFIWLVDVLCTAFGDESLAIAGALPLSWSHARLTLGSSVPDLAGAASARAARVPEMCGNVPRYTDFGCAASNLVEIRLLGYPEVRVRNVSIPMSKLEQRRAKSLLILLAASPSHALGRQEILDSIWPSVDFYRGSRAFANALSVLRGVLSVDPLETGGVDIVRASKESSGVALDMSHVTCDVDRLMELACQALDAGNDHRRALRLAREVEDLYRGDLCVPPDDFAGIAQARMAEVRSAYVDALVCGARAAVHLSENIVACRLARKAYHMDITREDVMQQLIDAYSAAGRFREVKKYYDEYADYLAEHLKVTPPAYLRRKYESLLKDEGTEPVQEPLLVSDLLEEVNVVPEMIADTDGSTHGKRPGGTTGTK